MGFRWISMIVFKVLILAGIVYLVQATTSRCKKPEANEAPVDILKRRYAKGKITTGDFDRIKDALMKSRNK